MKIFGLTGKSLSHSFSQHYFSEKFLRENFHDCSYELFELENPDQVRKLIHSNPSICGLNVTIPFKETIIPFLDHLDQQAMQIGAVNTISIVRKKKKIVLTGHNTDVWGFENSAGELLKYKKALVLGTGGSAKAVGFVLKKYGIRALFVSRSPSGTNEISYDDLSTGIVSEYLFIVNTTPLGMYPEAEKFPCIPFDGLSPNHFLFDLIYNPPETVFMKKGQAAGTRVMNGLRMLELQAERSWEIWNR